jgi:predicted transcriptional regulator
MRCTYQAVQERYKLILAFLNTKHTIDEILPVVEVSDKMMRRYINALIENGNVERVGSYKKNIQGRHVSYYQTVSHNISNLKRVLKPRTDYVPVKEREEYEAMESNKPERVIVQGNVTTYNLSHHDNYSHRRAPVKPTIMGSSMRMF